jgi:hypothetical protein
MRKTWMTLAVLTSFVSTSQLFAEDKDAASAMQELGNQLAMENPEGGGSIRAKKEPDMAAQTRKNDKRNIQARVVSVKRADAFPQVALVVKVMKPAEDGPKKDKVKKDDQLIIMPTYKLTGKAVDLASKDTVLNAGAYYLTDNDIIAVRLGELKGKIWSAEYVERK